MLKVYKRTIHIGKTEAGHGDGLSMNTDNEMTGSMKVLNWLSITALIAGTIVGTLVFSVFFIAILIPLGLLGFGAWLRLRQLKKSLNDQNIEAEYTVITDTVKKTMTSEMTNSR